MRQKYASPRAVPIKFDTEDVMIASGTVLDLDNITENSGVGVYAWPF